MLVTTTEKIPGKEYKVLGLVKGNCIQSKNILRDMTQGLRSIVGGELKQYTKMLEEARNTATERMIEHARTMDADAVVMTRYGSGSVGPDSAEIIAYGTAVKFI